CNGARALEFCSLFRAPKSMTSAGLGSGFVATGHCSTSVASFGSSPILADPFSAGRGPCRRLADRQEGRRHAARHSRRSDELAVQRGARFQKPGVYWLFSRSKSPKYRSWVKLLRAGPRSPFVLVRAAADFLLHLNIGSSI